MTGLGIFLLVVLGFWLLWPIVAKWLRRQAANKAEDFIRNATGMPPRPGSRRDRRERRERERNGNNEEDYYAYRSRQRKTRYTTDNEPLIPKEYAEDVEFVEIKEFSSTESKKVSETGEIYFESQISDAEYTEIKKNRN